jgi:uncharacterized protein (TIGR02145 family)
MTRIFTLFLILNIIFSGFNAIAGITTNAKLNPQSGFIENKGQIINLKHIPNASVLFLLNRSGSNVQLRKDGFSYDLTSLQQPPTQSSYTFGNPPSSNILFHRIDVTFEGANPDCRIVARDPLPEYFNYYNVCSSSKGISDVLQYKKVIYQEMYDGIDLEFVMDETEGFKYNFIISPGAELQNIKFKIEGADFTKANHDTLKIVTTLGIIEELIPRSYYSIDDLCYEVKAEFINVGEGIYGFAINDILPANSKLVIDPTSVRIWGTYYGGTGWDGETYCSVDKSGNVYLSGSTNSTNNIASSGAYQDTLGGDYDGFIAKFNAAGQREWSTYFGGVSLEEVFSCVVDNDSNVYVSGSTESGTGIASTGAHQSEFGGFRDCYIEKFNQSGERLWGTYYGGSNDDNKGTVSVDNFGNVLLSGETYSETGIATTGSFQDTLYNGTKDVFLAKFNGNGVRLWGTYYGGEALDENFACTTDIWNNILVCGSTKSHTNIASSGAFQSTYGGDPYDAFIAKFSTTGQRIWASYYGGLNEERGWAVTTDSLGNILIAGRTNSVNGIASTTCFQSVFGGGLFDAFLVKFDTSGQRLWGTYYGGTGEDLGWCCKTGWNGAVFLGGYTTSNNNITTPKAYQPLLNGANDGFLVKFDTSGQRLWGTYYGGTGYGDAIMSIGYIAHDTIIFAGYTYSLDFISSAGAWQEVYGGSRDAMLIKLLDCWPIDAAGPVSGANLVCKPATGLSYSIPSLPHSVSYVWTVPPGFTITSGSSSAAITLDVSSGATSGLISVKGLNKCGDPGDSASLSVTVSGAPVPVVSGPNNTCAGTGKVYTTDPGKSNYQWSVSAGGVITAGGTSTDNTVTVTWNVSGTEHVYLNYTDAGCSAAAPVNYPVQVNPSPAVTIVITPDLNSICQGSLVTFNSSLNNEGVNPVFQWQVNGITTGGNLSSFSYTPVNNDVVRCILTSSVTGCIMNNPDTSNEVTMIVNPNLPVGITITALPNPPVCAGTLVTFTAHPVNEGGSPTYQWKVNGINAGANSLTYSFIPLNGDLVSCTLTSNATCVTNNPASSIPYPVSVDPILPVSITISASSNPFCLGSPVTFLSFPLNGGATPSYQWKVNGINQGTNSATFIYIPANGDLVSCIVTSSEPCTSGNPASSIPVLMTAISNLPAGVTIAASPNPFCPGSTVNFLATPNNGGSLPAYQWKVNGGNVGTNSDTYSYNPANGDSVRCIMTSNLSCVTGNPASSNKIIMNGSLSPAVSFSSCFDTITTINAKPIRLKGGIPLGGTFSGPGVSGGYYYPNLAGAGTHQITYTYTNASLCTASKSLQIHELANSPSTCGKALTDPRDNRQYATIQIGTQCWMAENLNFGNVLSSTQDQRDNCVAEKYCYNDNPANCVNLGGIYQWDELMLFDETPASQGLCPPAWHIPTENDWNTLFAVFINNGFAGNPLKYSGYSGFNALLSGARHVNKGWNFQGFATFFWSSTRHGADKAFAHGMNDPDPSVSLYLSSRANGFSVRCVKD